ncbi:MULTISPECIES: hypothetical protein [Clostridium]|uniref:hypothetical protein n=1 Tax=Clostridium TaxID=1485 RepID=UPI000824669D|nr:MULTISPECIES: hypothetical protein [Clostridium]PJI06595.1 hypothetical protein CUB90_01370 [Clostridium sp. CT7]
MKDEKRFKTVCSECGHTFYACKSIAQELGLLDAGHGSCPECKTFLNLTFDKNNNETKTIAWNKYLKSVGISTFDENGVEIKKYKAPRWNIKRRR